MDNKFSFKNFKLLPKKQQQAIYTIGFSLLAFVLVVIISCVFLFAGNKKPSSSSSSQSQSSSNSSSSSAGESIDDPITDSKYGETILKKQDNKDANYLKETLFIGDSNTERLMEYGHISIDNFVGKTGLSITGAATEACVYFKNDDKAYTIPAAVAKMKPRRVVITLGTNDASVEAKAADFVKSYETFIKAVTDAYPHAQVIINSIPPVTKNTTYKSINMNTINDLNEALADMALEKNYKFLNSSELLRDTSGYGKASYFTKEDGVHLVDGGARALMDFVRTHPETTEDKRPDTKNIPTRRAAPSTTSSSTSSSKVEEDVTITYSVQMDGKTAMGSLKNDTIDKKTSYTNTFKDKDKKFSITAVAAEGYTFAKWSDGVKEATRSDSMPKESLKITAQFTKNVAFSLTLDKNDFRVEEGTAFTINATVAGNGTDPAKIVWKVDGAQVSVGKTFNGNYSPAKETVYTIEASYPDKETKATIKVTVTKKTPTSTPTPPTPPAATTITFGGDTSGTVGKNVHIDVLVINPVGDTTWSVSPDNVSGKTNSIDFVPKGTGNVVITATNNGKTESITILIKEKPAPVKELKFGYSQPEVLGLQIAFTGAVFIDTVKSDAETALITWTISDGTTGTGGDINHTFAAAGTYTITMNATGVAPVTISVNVKG